MNTLLIPTLFAALSTLGPVADPHGDPATAPARHGGAAAPLGDAAGPLPAVDLDTLKANLTAEFGGSKFIGYAFAISKDGAIRRAGAGGFAQRPGDNGFGVEMKTTTRMNVASVSKTVTAIAVLQLLEKNNLTVTSRIAPHLPPAWARGYGFANNANSLTFKDLLTHKSGLKQRFVGMSEAERAQWNNSFDGLKFIVEKGVNAADVGEYAYKNANFSLFKVIIPILWMKSTGSPWQNMDAATAGILHMSYVQNFVFKPAGVTTSTGCYQQLGVEYAAGYDIYDVAVPTQPGTFFFRDYPDCGGHANWHLSARQLCRIAMHADSSNYGQFPASEELLSLQAAFARDLYKLGWDHRSDGPKAQHIGKFWHSGYLKSNKRVAQACMMKLPGGINVAVIVNSESTDGESPAKKVIDAYEASL